MMTDIYVVTRLRVLPPTEKEKETELAVSEASLNVGKKRCHNLSFLSRYQSGISIHPWVYRFSLPALSNLSQLLWLLLPLKP